MRLKLLSIRCAYVVNLAPGLHFSAALDCRAQPLAHCHCDWAMVLWLIYFVSGDDAVILRRFRSWEKLIPLS